MPDKFDKAEAIIVAHEVASIMPVPHASPPSKHAANVFAPRHAESIAALSQPARAITEL